MPSHGRFVGASSQPFSEYKRKPGDRIRPLEDGPSQKIKQFFQLTSIPPWLRASIPVLDWDGEAVALGDWVLGHRLREWLLENDLDYQWQPDDSVLARLSARPPVDIEPGSDRSPDY